MGQQLAEAAQNESFRDGAAAIDAKKGGCAAMSIARGIGTSCCYEL